LNIINVISLSNILFGIDLIVTFLFVLIVLAGLASLILYTIAYKDDEMKQWSWSYILGWVGCGLHSVGIILLCWAGYVSSEE